MTFNDPVFKAFNDFDIDDMLPQADIFRRVLRRLEDIDNSTTATTMGVTLSERRAKEPIRKRQRENGAQGEQVLAG